MTRRLRIAHAPLMDAALLIIARNLGFDREEGLAFDLQREESWAAIRDKLAVGVVDAAHFLAPAALALNAGLGGVKAALAAPIALGLDGNAITVSAPLFGEIMSAIDGDSRDPAATAAALGRIVAARRARREAPLRFAHVFPWSTHHYQLRMWLSAGGIGPHDVALSVVPPPRMGESLRARRIDGFCVGEPWNALAAISGAGKMMHSGRAIMRDCPEKVLAFRAEFAAVEPDILRGAARAVEKASDWLAARDPVDALTPIATEALAGLADAESTRAGLALAADVDTLPRFDRAALTLSARQVDWIVARMDEAGHVEALEPFRRSAVLALKPLTD